MLAATVLAPSAAEADALATALYVLGRGEIARIAPPGGDVAAVLVLPEPSGRLRVVVANLDPAELAIEMEPGLVVTWLPPPGGSDASSDPVAE